MREDRNLTVINNTSREMEVANDTTKDTNQSILSIRNAGLLRRMFPDEQYKEYAKSQLTLIKTELEFRKRALEIFRNSQIEVMRKSMDAWASTKGIEIDKEKEKNIRKLIDEREEEMTQSVDDFMQKYEKAYKRTSGWPEGRAKDLEIKRLDKTLEGFFERIRFFNEEFEKSLKFSSQKIRV